MLSDVPLPLLNTFFPLPLFPHTYTYDPPRQGNQPSSAINGATGINFSQRGLQIAQSEGDLAIKCFSSVPGWGMFLRYQAQPPSVLQPNCSE